MYRFANSPLLCSTSWPLRRNLSNLIIRPPLQPTRQLTWTSIQCRRPILSSGKSSVTLLMQCRNMGGPKTVGKLFRKDNVDPTKFEMIYRSDLSTYFLWCQWGMLSTAVVFTFMAVSETLIAIFPQLAPKPLDYSEKRSFGGYFVDMDEVVRTREVLSEQQNDLAYDWLYLDRYIEGFGPSRHIALAAGVLLLVAAVSKLMRMVPVRMYSSITNPDRCVASHYSYFIPGRIVTRELQAGTLEPYYKWKILPAFNNIYKDNKGVPYLIYSRFFRSTSEYFRLLSEETRKNPLILDTKDARPGETPAHPEKISWKQFSVKAQLKRLENQNQK